MTPDSASPPEGNQPPVIQGPPPPPLGPASKLSAGRQPILLLLNVCLAFFVADALFSLLDDSLALVLHFHGLAGLRGIVGSFALFIAFLVYLLMGLTRAVPKRIFLPLTLFNPVALLLTLPAWIYFSDRMQQVSWLISLVQVLLSLAILWFLQGESSRRWPLVSKECLLDKGFSWANLLGFLTANLLVLFPVVLAYCAFCSALAVDHFSDGFVALRRVGFTVQVRKYVRDDGKSILLVPMSHIGEPEFYRSLAQSFPTNSTILMEGVTDDKNLLTNRISYKRMANSLGLAQQQREFKPSPLQVVHADIDVDQFTPRTIDFLNLVMLIHTQGLTVENVLRLMQSSEPPDFEQQLFEDILHKRNRHLLQQIQEQARQSDDLIVPWGAAHMPEIAREIQKSGFHLASAREYVAIRFHHR